MATEFKPQARKDVREAVMIAALCSVATGLISWGIDEAKRKVANQRLNKRKKKTAKKASRS